MGSLKENDPEIQDGLLAFYLSMNLILIRIPDSSMEIVIARQREEIERWKDDADSILVFVCARSTIICIFPSK